jgi:hypothetical protein
MHTVRSSIDVYFYIGLYNIYEHASLTFIYLMSCMHDSALMKHNIKPQVYVYNTYTWLIPVTPVLHARLNVKETQH